MGSASAESIGVSEPMFFQLKGRVTLSGRPALLVFLALESRTSVSRKSNHGL